MASDDRFFGRTMRVASVVVGGALAAAVLGGAQIGFGSPGIGSVDLMLIAIGGLLIASGLSGSAFLTHYKTAAVILLNAVVLIVVLDGLATGVLSVVAETASGQRRNRSDLAYYQNAEWGSNYWREFEASLPQAYYPYVIWRRRPYAGETINIAQDRMRVTPGADCSANALTIFVFGGSTVWGTGAPDWATIPAYLQAALAAKRNAPVCVVNFGESGYVSTQSLVLLVLQLQRGWIPDVVIFYDGANDVGAGVANGVAAVHDDYGRIGQFFERQTTGPESPFAKWSAGLGLVRLSRQLAGLDPVASARSAQSRPPAALGVADPDVVAAVVRTYARTYELVEQLGRAYGFESFFFWQPLLPTSDKPLTPEQRTMLSELDRIAVSPEDYRSAAELVEQIAADHPNMFSLRTVFDQDTTQIWIDFVHVTPHGNERVARAILNAIEPALERAR